MGWSTWLSESFLRSIPSNPASPTLPLSCLAPLDLPISAQKLNLDYEIARKNVGHLSRFDITSKTSSRFSQWKSAIRHILSARSFSSSRSSGISYCKPGACGRQNALNSWSTHDRRRSDGQQHAGWLSWKREILQSWRDTESPFPEMLETSGLLSNNKLSEMSSEKDGIQYSDSENATHENTPDPFGPILDPPSRLLGRDIIELGAKMALRMWNCHICHLSRKSRSIEIATGTNWNSWNGRTVRYDWILRPSQSQHARIIIRGVHLWRPPRIQSWQDSPGSSARVPLCKYLTDCGKSCFISIKSLNRGFPAGRL